MAAGSYGCYREATAECQADVDLRDNLGTTAMLGKLFDKWREQSQIRQILKNPIVQGGQLAVSQYWTNNTEVIKDFSKELIETTAGKMMETVIGVASSQNPLMANREKLAGYVADCAQYQVLVIEPPPAEDVTGARGHYGVSGRLRERLVEIATKNKNVKEFMHGFPEVKTWDDVWNPVLMRYRYCYAWMHIFHLLRAHIGDFNKEREWFRPFYLCMCGWQEHLIRDSIGLPTLMGDDASLKALMLSSFFNRVVEGHKYPDLQYVEGIKEIHNGEWYDELKPLYK
jgi:hypothetical protein